VVDINVEVDLDFEVGIETMIQPQAYERMPSGWNEGILHHDLDFSSWKICIGTSTAGP
jgi:hypothetical protein